MHQILSPPLTASLLSSCFQTCTSRVGWGRRIGLGSETSKNPRKLLKIIWVTMKKAQELISMCTIMSIKIVACWMIEGAVVF